VKDVVVVLAILVDLLEILVVVDMDDVVLVLVNCIVLDVLGFVTYSYSSHAS
jgi:hypothetical protein